MQVTINRPQRRNAFTPHTGEPLPCLLPNIALSWYLAWPLVNLYPKFSLKLHLCPSLTIKEKLSLCNAAVKEMSLCFEDARDDSKIGVVILTGELHAHEAYLACFSNKHSKLHSSLVVYFTGNYYGRGRSRLHCRCCLQRCAGRCK